MKIEKLESLRGFAAIYVALHHAFYTTLLAADNKLHYLFKHGDLGVMVFFILSGFVIKLSFERSEDKSFKTYFFKRFLRIYIPLILIFIANYFVQFVEGNGINGFSLYRLLTNLLMLQTNGTDPNFAPLFNNAPLWSLSFEWWFYMIFFLFFKLFKNKNTSFIIYSIGVLACIFSLFYISFASQIFIFIMIWWLGVDIASLYLSNKKISFYNLKYQIITIVSCMIFLKLMHHNYNLQYLAMSLFILFVGIIWSKLKWVYFDKTIGLFLPFSVISYAVYISHWFLVSSASYLDFIQIDIIRYVLYFLVCFAFSYLVEKVIYPRLNILFMRKIFPEKYIKP